MNTNEINQHRLRYMVDQDSTISDTELDEIEGLLPMDEYFDEYEYCGGFILSKSVATRDEAVSNMCCGIMTRDIKLSNGEEVYFAFDYGH